MYFSLLINQNMYYLILNITLIIRYLDLLFDQKETPAQILHLYILHTYTVLSLYLRRPNLRKSDEETKNGFIYFAFNKINICAIYRQIWLWFTIGLSNIYCKLGITAILKISWVQFFCQMKILIILNRFIAQFLIQCFNK